MPPSAPAPRARRAAASAAVSARLRPWLVLGLPAALVLIVGALFGIRAWVYHYLRSDDFRHDLDRRASAALHADGHFAPLRWEATEVFTNAFDATGNPAEGDTPLSRLAAEQIRARLDLGALWRRTWRVESIDLERLAASLSDNTAGDASRSRDVRDRSGSQGTPAVPGGFPANLLPNHVEIGSVNVNNFSLAWNASQPDNAGHVESVRVTAHPNTASDLRSWQIDGRGGRLSRAHFPDLRLTSFRLKTTPRELFITNAEAEPEVGGHVGLTGSLQLDDERALDLRGDFDAVPASEFLPVDWRARLKGLAHGTVEVMRSETSPGGRASGHVELREGRLTALPLLDQLALFTTSERYRQASLQKAQADFDWANGDLTVRDLLLESEGLLRLEGGFKVHAGQIDGTLQVGVARSIVRWLPVVGTRVFNLPERDGYVWTPMHLSGPVDHPNEDLTQRLAGATQQEVIDKAQQGVNGVIDTAKGLLDLLH